MPSLTPGPSRSHRVLSACFNYIDPNLLRERVAWDQDSLNRRCELPFGEPLRWGLKLPLATLSGTPFKRLRNPPRHVG
jgi:hypothetical protein